MGSTTNGEKWALFASDTGAVGSFSQILEGSGDMVDNTGIAVYNYYYVGMASDTAHPSIDNVLLMSVDGTIVTGLAVCRSRRRGQCCCLAFLGRVSWLIGEKAGLRCGLSSRKAAAKPLLGAASRRRSRGFDQVGDAGNRNDFVPIVSISQAWPFSNC